MIREITLIFEEYFYYYFHFSLLFCLQALWPAPRLIIAFQYSMCIDIQTHINIPYIYLQCMYIYVYVCIFTFFIKTIKDELIN